MYFQKILKVLIILYFRRVITSNIFLTAREACVNLKDGYNGDLSSRDAGRIGGNMVRKLIEQAESNMANK